MLFGSVKSCIIESSKISPCFEDKRKYWSLDLFSETQEPYRENNYVNNWDGVKGKYTDGLVLWSVGEPAYVTEGCIHQYFSICFYPFFFSSLKIMLFIKTRMSYSISNINRLFYTFFILKVKMRLTTVAVLVFVEVGGYYYINYKLCARILIILKSIWEYSQRQWKACPRHKFLGMHRDDIPAENSWSKLVRCR